MTVTEIHAYLTAITPELQSMQIFDAMALCVKQAAEIKNLAKLLVSSGQLTLDITSDTTDITIGDTHVASVSRNLGETMIVFDRYVLAAKLTTANGATVTLADMHTVYVTSVGNFQLTVV
jgi:hypothetical protein